MSTASAAQNRSGSTVREHVSPAARRRFRIAGRLGYAAHGMVYALVGLMALDAAVLGGSADGEREAIARLGSGAVGMVTLSTLAAGLLMYSALRLWQGVADPDDHGKEPKALVARAGLCIGGLAALGLALYAITLATGWFAGQAGSGGDDGVRDGTARIMMWPGGRLAIALAGAAVVGTAIYFVRKAIKADFMDELDVSETQKRWVRPLGRAGFGARAITFAVTGGFVIFAAATADPDEARGLGGALRTVQEQAFGRIALGVVAIGLLAFAATRMAQARFKAEIG